MENGQDQKRASAVAVFALLWVVSPIFVWSTIVVDDTGMIPAMPLCARALSVVELVGMRMVATHKEFA